MKKLRNYCLLGAIALGISITTACNTWPAIIATAEAISSVTSVFYPGVGSLSTLAVKLLQQAEAAQVAYKANQNASTEAALVAAIQSIETQLPADEAALNIPAGDQQKVAAAINIIMDYVEALAVAEPATAEIVRQARAARAQPGVACSTAGRNGGQVLLPKPMSDKRVRDRWEREVCGGEQKCTALARK